MPGPEDAHALLRDLAEVGGKSGAGHHGLVQDVIVDDVAFAAALVAFPADQALAFEQRDRLGDRGRADLLASGQLGSGEAAGIGGVEAGQRPGRHLGQTRLHEDGGEQLLVFTHGFGAASVCRRGCAGCPRMALLRARVRRSSSRGDHLGGVRGLVADDARNDQVCRDVHVALGRGRNCLVLTRQTAHVQALAQRMRELGHDPHLLYATRKIKELKQVLAFLSDPPPDGPPLLVIAIDKYVGEGYDCPKLDTLFLAHPVSFKGSMVQYVGRILRSHPGKTTVEVHDYVDGQVGVLAAMWRKRSRSYSQLGFTVSEPDHR